MRLTYMYTIHFQRQRQSPASAALCLRAFPQCENRQQASSEHFTPQVHAAQLLMLNMLANGLERHS